jgi:hypothetical protein
MSTKTEIMTNIPVYRNTPAYAREHNELELFRSSNLANIACRSEIERNIAALFDGMHLHPQVAEPALHIFGAERVLHVLANTVQRKGWDGRLSADNKAWAKGFDIPEDNVMDVDRRVQYVINSHPAVLDGYIRLMRQTVQERQKPSLHAALQNPTIRAAKPHHCKSAAQER